MATQADQLQNWTISRSRTAFRAVKRNKRRQIDHDCSGKTRNDQDPLAELLKSCLNAQPEAWNEFVRRFQRLIAVVVIKSLRRYGNLSPSTVDDLVQETYLKLCDNNFKALREFDCRHEHALAGFLKVIASNVAQDYLRSSRCQKRGSGKGEDDLEVALLRRAYAVTTVEIMEREIVLQQVQQCLERELSEPHSARDCRIFWLHYRNGLTAKAIAQCPEIGLSIKGVESALFRLTNLVRTKLGNHEQNSGSQKATIARSCSIRTS